LELLIKVLILLFLPASELKISFKARNAMRATTAIKLYPKISAEVTAVVVAAVAEVADVAAVVVVAVVIVDIMILPSLDLNI
jgi:hypothetical protein